MNRYAVDENLAQSEGTLSAPHGAWLDPRQVYASTQMFGDDIAIFGGCFYQCQNLIQNSYNCQAEAFQSLQAHVASGAFHNSTQRVDPPRCHPDTRVKILQDIYDWATQFGVDRTAWVMWLNGAAGAGKSAIMQSIAEQLVALVTNTIIALASFFFCKGDPTRNTTAPLVATLAYQLMQSFPETTEAVLQVVHRNPLIFSQSVEFQLRELIIHPLQQLPLYLQRLFVVIIDGLDECIDRNLQVDLIEALGKISSNRDISIIFLIASRREAQIVSEFRKSHLSSILQTIDLDRIQASDDIRGFLNAKFAEIKVTHPFCHLLPFEWPAPFVVNQLVAKASGQFIFGSVVINFISSPRRNPAQQLKIVYDLRLRDPSSEHPFAHLDSLYRYIFSQADHLDKVLDILAYKMINPMVTNKVLELNLGLYSGELEVLMVDFASIIHCDPQTETYPSLRFLHASIRDFLLDKTRSEQYFINLDKYREKLLCNLLVLPRPVSFSNPKGDQFMRLGGIGTFILRVKASDRLRHAFRQFNYPFCIDTDNNRDITNLRIDLLRRLKRRNLKDNGESYQHVLDVIATGYSDFWPMLDDRVKDSVRRFPDLCRRIQSLRPHLQKRPSLEEIH